MCATRRIFVLAIATVKEGEASIFKPNGAGGYTLIACLQANDWSKLAQTGSN